MKQIRRYMCVDEIPDKTERVLDLNVLPRIRELLISSTSHIQYEACWILTNIAAGNSGHTSAVVNSDFIPPLIALLTSETDQVRVQAAWALGNIAGDCKEYTQLLLDHGIIQPLLAIPYRICYDRKKDIQARHVVCWVIANLCRWDNKDWKQVEPCFEVIQETVLRFDDQDVLSEAIWAMSRIFHAKNSGCEQLIQVDLIRKLVHGINSPRLSVQTPVLRCMTNISGDLDPSHTQVLIDAGILESIKKILSVAYNHQPAVIAEVLHCLSNITAGTTSQKQAVHTVGLFRHVHDLLGSRDMKVRKEACHVLRNAVDRDATPEHFRDVVGSEGEIFLPLTTLLADSQGDLSSQLHVIETLNIIFSRGNEPEIRALYPNFEAAVTGQNVYVTAMTEMSPQNFANIFKVYEALFLSPDDDLAPLMVQCVVAEREVQKQNGVEEKRVVDAVVGHFKPGLSGADFVKAEKLRRAVARDLGFMMDQYLHVQRKKVVDDLIAMDLISGGLERLVVAVRGREAQE
ncbi:ARM repeat-containing protein [Rhizoclosmatium globosum]|uniref:ARM repeat-containing protein n=1 Tax=Rhizoclosmatium globosum TaxID=329046 RepID=A0A1Y2CLK3_9FUNG|nr:ARM repeat-containing protein [Rhizoclosmatium globosum]|eukprot:ORY47902.1 ARM repeat-containing protein [Rhizoclosmatium globosum]